MILQATAEIAGTLDIPANVGITPSFHENLVKIIGCAVQLTKAVAGINISKHAQWHLTVE
jgi:hypothetical protein